MQRLTDALDFQAQALVLRAERQRLIASNIANADTPGYQARDMDFAQALREATGRRSRPALARDACRATCAGRAARAPSRTCCTPRRARPTSTATRVDMDRERAEFADNAVQVRGDAALHQRQRAHDARRDQGPQLTGVSHVACSTSSTSPAARSARRASG